MSDPRVVALIDDDVGIRVAISSLLRSGGYAVRVFAGAEEFLADERELPDCVVTDVQMPGLSGLDLQDIIRSRFPALPVVVITAFPEAVIRDRALAGGACGFLSKPFDAEAMFSCLEKALSPE